MNRWITPELLAAFEAENTTAHRLYTSHAAWVERLGSDLLLSHRQETIAPDLLDALQEWRAASGLEIQRIFTRFIPRQNAERIAPVLLEGDASLPLQNIVSERGVRYGVDLGAGYSAGLFIDQRENRSHLRQLAPRRLLNTFAYTASFSVVAALEGAETLSVDLSRKSLDRGRENFALNGLAHDNGQHRWIADDVLDLLPRLIRRNETFDAIILDPPTFSRGNRGRRWQAERDLEDLVLLAMELAAPGASILISTNCTRIDRPRLEAMARFALKAHRRGGDLHHVGPLPDFPRGEGASTLWMRLRS